MDIWQLGINLADSVYDITEKFPKSQAFGLTQQMQRAGISVSSNIAEGYNRNSKKEFSHFLDYTRGSLGELDTQLQIALNRKFITIDNFELMQELCDRISKMVWALQSTLKNRSPLTVLRSQS